MIKYWQKLLSLFIPHYGTVYRRIGGIKSINSLVDDFYHVMRTDPEAKECLATHNGKDLKESALKLKAFLSGWTGGPQLFLQKYGHPRLRARHFAFAIGDVEARQWLYCMQKALEKSQIKSEDQQELMKAFAGLAQLVRNRDT